MGRHRRSVEVAIRFVTPQNTTEVREVGVTHIQDKSTDAYKAQFSNSWPNTQARTHRGEGQYGAARRWSAGL